MYACSMNPFLTKPSQYLSSYENVSHYSVLRITSFVLSEHAIRNYAFIVFFYKPKYKYIVCESMDHPLEQQQGCQFVVAKVIGSMFVLDTLVPTPL